jgi:tetratricopeptide (TPR) repeat protein
MINRVVPSKEYFTFSLRRFNEGNFNAAFNDFNKDLQQAVKIPDANGQMFLWLDSMTYWIMCGECHYQAARYDDALRAFNNALQIYLTQPDWLKQISYAGGPAAVPRQPFAWGTSARKGGMGDFRQCKFQILQENINIINLGKHGTAVQQNAQMNSIHADEIISRMALMVRRRAEILGPLSKYDPQTKLLSEVLGGKPCPPNHFTGVWVDVLYGLALSAMGDDAAAIPELERGLLMQGQFDHQLTPAALYELGNIARRANKNEDAQKNYLEASFSAFLAGDWVLLGETFRKMSDTQKLIDKNKPFPPIAAALAFFGGQKDVSPFVLVPLCLEKAEDALSAGNAAGAATLNVQASNIMSKRDIAASVHGARSDYIAAMLSYTAAYNDYVNGKPPLLQLQAGDKHLETALGFVNRGSLWLHQLRVLESFFRQNMITTRGPITIRIADELYDLLLRDPTANDWAVQPMDSLAAMTSVPPEAFERWFNAALQRGDKERAFNISEKARRAKFFSSFTLGPRLFSLRILFEGSSNDITPQMQLERQTLSLDFTKFNDLSKKVRDIKQQLQTVPLVPKEQAQIEKQKQLFNDLEKYSYAQEAMLRSMALTRTKVPNVFPPVLTLEQIRKELPEGTAMLVFVQALGTYHGFLLDSRNLDMWTLTQELRADSLQKLITDYLDALGNKDPNRSISVKDMTDPKAKWKETGQKLLNRLLGNKPRPVNFTELVIVPTGPLWYVPFEAMCVGDKELRPLITAGKDPLRVRYSPTASLGVPVQGGGRSAAVPVLTVCGKFVSKEGPEVSLNAVDRLIKAGIQNIVPMPATLSDANYRGLPASSSAFASQVKQLVVLDDIPVPQNGLPLGWSPFSMDKDKLKNSVGTWLNLPWGGPQLIILPGFHTPAETSLKVASRGTAKAVPNGDDLFLSAMALEACGAKTVLISRWRTGGRASYDLTEHFLKNYAVLPAAEAWQQALLDVGSEPLTLNEEPRVRVSAAEKDIEPPLANHPFFWGAFMLIDRGEKPEQAAAKPASGLD